MQPVVFFGQVLAEDRGAEVLRLPADGGVQNAEGLVQSGSAGLGVVGPRRYPVVVPPEVVGIEYQNAASPYLHLIQGIKVQGLLGRTTQFETGLVYGHDVVRCAQEGVGYGPVVIAGVEIAIGGGQGESVNGHGDQFQFQAVQRRICCVLYQGLCYRYRIGEYHVFLLLLVVGEENSSVQLQSVVHPLGLGPQFNGVDFLGLIGTQGCGCRGPAVEAA